MAMYNLGWKHLGPNCRLP